MAEPTKIIVSYTFYQKVVSVEEVKENYNYRKKDPTKDPSPTNTECDTRTLGWTVRMLDGSAVGMFPENPGWVKGDEIAVTMRKKV